MIMTVCCSPDAAGRQRAGNRRGRLSAQAFPPGGTLDAHLRHHPPEEICGEQPTAEQ